jgi:hypothetical protein
LAWRGVRSIEANINKNFLYKLLSTFNDHTLSLCIDHIRDGGCIDGLSLSLFSVQSVGSGKKVTGVYLWSGGAGVGGPVVHHADVGVGSVT